MRDRTPTQRASRDLAEAVFADPALKERFEAMVEDTNSRELARDDFSWIPPEVRNAKGA